GLEAERGEVLCEAGLVGRARNVRQQPSARLIFESRGLALALAREQRRQVVLDGELYGLLKAERRRPLRDARRARHLRPAREADAGGRLRRGRRAAHRRALRRTLRRALRAVRPLRLLRLPARGVARLIRPVRPAGLIRLARR